MARSPIVSAYAFTAADGTNISALNGGNDWVEQNGNSAQNRVITNLFHNGFGNFADNAWKGAGVGSFTANQYFEIVLSSSAFNDNDNVGGALLNNSGAFGSNSLYRVYLFDNAGGAQAVNIDRVVNGSALNIFSVAANGTSLPDWGNLDKLSCEVTIVSGSPVFQIYQNKWTGSAYSGLATYGSTFTDSNAAKRTTGVPGLTAASSGDVLRGGPYEAGNLATAGAALAGTPADASSAAGKLNSDFAGAPADPTAATGSLYPFPSAQTTDASTVSAALSTQIETQTAASDTSAATGALTNFASVTLSGPLYTGVGGILDPSFWVGSLPQDGTVVWYDPTFITVTFNGEISSTTNNCSAIVQFQDGSGAWWVGVVTITPNLVAYPTSVASLTAALSTAIQLLGAAQTLVSAAGSLNTQILPRGAANAVTFAAATLATTIQLAASATSTAVASGAFAGSQQSLASNPTDTSAATAALNTQIQMIGAAVSLATALSSLATQIVLRSSALSLTSAISTLSSGITVNGAAVSVSSATASLLTGKPLVSAASSASAAVAQLITAIEFLSAPTDTSSAAGSLSVPAQLAANAASISTSIAALSTLIQYVSAAQDTTAATGSLSTQARFAGDARSQSQVAAELSTLGSMESDAASDSSATGALSTGIPLKGGAQDDSSGAAGLFTSIDPDANATDESQASGELGVVGSRLFHADLVLWAPPEIDWPSDGLLPFGRVFQRVDQRLIYAVAWSQWLAQRWQKEMQVAVGDRVRLSHSPTFQLKCIGAGVTGESEPRCPASIGAELLDGTAQWQVEPLDDQSLAAIIVPPVSWSADSFVIAFTNQRQVGQTTLVTIDTSLAISGVDYDVTVAVNTSDGREKSGKIRIKVR